MRTLFRAGFICCALVLGITSKAAAEPVLQLDIIGGHYDEASESIVSDGPSFTLVALLTPQSWEDVTETYYISAALTPQTSLSEGGDFGSFSFAGQNIAVTGDMNWGTPPVEDTGLVQDADGHDLGSHSIYPTYFKEFAFSFNSPLTQHSATYNTAENPGGPTAGFGSLYRTFEVNLNLDPGYQLHFDFYSSFFKSECTGPNKRRICTSDEDIDEKAPFSHDAQSGPGRTPPPPPPPPIPEPATLVMLATGLAMSARGLRRLPRRK